MWGTSETHQVYTRGQAWQCKVDSWPIGPSWVVCSVTGFLRLLYILPLKDPLHLRLCIIMTGKDTSLHPLPPPVCARILHLTTWPHKCPFNIQSVAYEQVYVWLCIRPQVFRSCHMLCSIHESPGKKKSLKVPLEKVQITPFWWKGKMEFCTIKHCAQHLRVGAIWELNTELLRQITNLVLSQNKY